MLIFTFYLVPNPKIILEFLNKLLAENFDGVNSAYNMFKYPVRGELRRKYYERRIRLFFDYILFLSGLFLCIIY